VVARISQLVSDNEALQRENRELSETNAGLRAELSQIETALARLGVAPRDRRGHGAGAPQEAEAPPRRQRRPITDPEILQRRRQALAKARAARAEKLAAARQAATSGE
jgi:hypothetical protein